MQTDMSCFAEGPRPGLDSDPSGDTAPHTLQGGRRPTPVHERSRECGLDFLSQDTHDTDMTSHHPIK